jgi:hypothetical protein
MTFNINNNALLGIDVTSLVVNVHELSPVNPMWTYWRVSRAINGRRKVCSRRFEVSFISEASSGVILSHGAVVESVLGPGSREVFGAGDDRVLQFQTTRSILASGRFRFHSILQLVMSRTGTQL